MVSGPATSDLRRYIRTYNGRCLTASVYRASHVYLKSCSTEARRQGGQWGSGVLGWRAPRPPRVVFVLGFASLINSLTSGKTDVSPFLSFSDVSALFIKMGKKCHNASTGYLFVNPWLTTDRPYTMYASRSRCGLRGLEPFRSAGVLRGCCAGAARIIHFRPFTFGSFLACMVRRDARPI